MSINQNRPVVRYENIALIQSDVSGYNLASNSGEGLSFLPLVQGINFSVNIPRTNAGALGTKDFVGPQNKSAPDVQFSIDTIEDFGSLFSGLVTGTQVRSDLNIDRSFYAYVSPSLGLDAKDKNSFGQFISFGNCFLSSLSISQSINDIMRSNYSFVASNIQAEEAKAQNVGLDDILYTGVSVPSLNLTGNQSQDLVTEISGINKYYTSVTEKIIPSYSTNVVISGNGSVGNFLIESDLIQGFNLNFNISRKQIYSVGKKYPITRKAVFPSECSFSFSNRDSTFQISGDRANLKDFLSSDEAYTLIVSGKNKVGDNFGFRINDARLSSHSNSVSIESDLNTDLGFGFELNRFINLP